METMWCLFDPSPSGWTSKLRNDILMFQKHQGESLSEAWTHFKDLLQKVPYHGIDLWLLIQILYDHVNPITRQTINQAAGGKLRDKSDEESWALLEDLTLYDNEIWSDPRDSAKPVKAISMPQDFPIKKIASSCEICSGPHDTQYCMKNPEQAFFEYASTRTDKAGGKCEFRTKENRFEYIQSVAPEKMKDPGLLILPCRLGDSKPFKTQADLGSCVNLLPLNLFKKLKIRLLEETDDVLGLADETKSYPIGIVKNVEVHVGKIKLFEDFHVVDIEREPTCPLLVGRRFLATANAIIVDIFDKRIPEVLRRFMWTILG
uniref:MAK10-like protein n=1 Tax=Tanacetum cinerariifolium TaxID=118510 RepID=A0A6L2JCF5_TANCI|nr:MAK10-like protein [Tanacetum cinerariifolium]